MRRLLTICILSVCMFLVGCGNSRIDQPKETVVTAENFLKLNTGMTLSQVRCVIGEPNDEPAPLHDKTILYSWRGSVLNEAKKIPAIDVYTNLEGVVVKLEARNLGPKRD